MSTDFAKTLFDIFFSDFKNWTQKSPEVVETSGLFALISFWVQLDGGPEETRTLDLSDANRTLSQLSYRPIYFPFDPENIDIISMFDLFVKAFFSIPAQI